MSTALSSVSGLEPVSGWSGGTLSPASLHAFAASQPMLSAREEFELATRFRVSQDLEAAQRLVLSHLRFVISLSRQYLGYGLPQADLVQEGSVGLMKAVKRFDPTRGIRLASFAIHWIKAEMHEFIIRNWRLVKVATTKAQRRLFFNLRSLKHSLGIDRRLTRDQAQEIAEALQVNPAEVLEMEQRLVSGDISLELPPDTSDGEGGNSPLLSLQAEAANPADLVEAQDSARQSQRSLSLALASLDPRSREIIQARWLVEGNETRTLHELAEEFGVSAERIRQIEKSALSKLKAAMEDVQTVLLPAQMR